MNRIVHFVFRTLLRPAYLIGVFALLCSLLNTTVHAQAMCTSTAGTPGICAGNPLNVLSGNKFQVEADMPALPGILGLELVRYYNSADSLPSGPRGILGRGWRLSYDTELRIEGNTITLVQADGTQVGFYQDITSLPATATNTRSTRYLTMTLGQGRLLALHASSGHAEDTEYTLTLPGKTRQTFDANGRLVRITAPSGEFTTLQRDPNGTLLRVTDPQGRFLAFGYLDKKTAQAGDRYRGVQHIDSPVGRFSYTYGSPAPTTSKDTPKDTPTLAQQRLANLVRVDLPTHYEPDTPVHAATSRGVSSSSVSKTYHYEDPRWPTLLTGISTQGQGSDGQLISQRNVTWAYDAQGRAVLSVKGVFDPKKPGLEQVQLDFSGQKPDGSGVTTLTNSLGQTTRYQYALVLGKPELLEAIGPGCATCSASNVRYRYDQRGRRTHEITLGTYGQEISATQTDYDAAHRPVKISTIAYVKGKPLAPVLQARYEYGADPDNIQPTLIERPSVVPGKLHTLRFTYNAQWQMTQVTESGYEPLNRTAIERTTTYAYSTINGRSVLTQIDGPLKNGPKATSEDSDITTFVYDGRADYLTSSTAPGNITTRFSYDPAGRIATQSLIDGYRQIDTNTTYAGLASIATQVRSVSRSAWLLNANGQPDSATTQILQVLQAQFDALGRRTRSTDSAGRIANYRFDGADHLLGVADMQGYRSQVSLDTEGRTRMAGLYLPDADNAQDRNKPYRASYYWHDAQGRPTQSLLPDGRLNTWVYDERGQLAQHTDGDDIRTTYLQAANKTATIRQTPDGWIRAALRSKASKPDSASTQMDDFGRVIQQALPDHGTKTARFDVADHLTQLANADGTAVQYDWDSAGRLLQKTYLDAQGQSQGRTTLTYRGRLLNQAQDPAQATDYRYDALGRKTSEGITLTGLTKPLTTAAQYNPETGLVNARTLADGRVLRTTRGDVSTGASVQALRLQGPWAAWLQDRIEALLPNSLAQLLVRTLPGQTIAQDIQVHPFNGLTGYTAGNGISTTKTYDIAGRMTALKVQGSADTISDLQYGYGVGPRIAKINDQQYRYRGFGKLDLGDSNNSKDGGMLKVSATQTGAIHESSMQATGLNVSQTTLDAKRTTLDALGRTTQDGQYRYTYTPAGQVETVSDLTGKLLAIYAYNSLGQRVRKTDGQTTTYYLWQNKQLVAELDGNGQLTTQYLYLSEGQVATPLVKLETASNPDNGTHQDRTLFIHTDHRATPMAMTDEKQQVVWRADMSPRGMMRVGNSVRPEPVEGQSVNQATLNIRLPGQYFDAEAGLHDNWQRTYNPRTGRYLQPDPLGYPDGPDAYSYVNGDPLNRIDPMGLYQEDIHYYMTYFLGVMAGMSEANALVMALGSQYVDDNPFTWPLDPNAIVRSYLTNPVAAADRLAAYHFTQSGYDPQRIEKWYVPTDAERVAAINAGNLPLPPYFSEPDDVYAARRIKNPYNPQLGRLLAAANHASAACTKTQLFGEYLHSFEDTFGHRNKSNESIDVNAGTGHALYGEQPDFTYNDSVYLTPYPGAIGNWDMREARTLEMEKEVFARIQSQFGTTGKDKLGQTITFDDIKATLTAFNAIHEDEGTGFTQKLALLDSKLVQFGFKPFGTKLRYDVTQACKNRQDNLKPIIDLGDTAAHSQYPGVILGTPQQCPTERGQLTQ